MSCYTAVRTFSHLLLLPSTFTIKKTQTTSLVLLVVEQILKFCPRVAQMVVFGVGRGKSPSLDGAMEGFAMRFWLAAALRWQEEEPIQSFHCARGTCLELQCGSCSGEWDSSPGKGSGVCIGLALSLGSSIGTVFAGKGYHGVVITSNNRLLSLE